MIFNATGIGARDLLNDREVYPTRGDLVYVRAHAGFEVPFEIMQHMAFYGEAGTHYAFPRHGELVLGGSFVEGDSSLEIRRDACEEILASFNRFYGLKAK